MQRIAIFTALLLAVESPVLGNEAPPGWAYPINPPGLKPAPDDGTPRRVPDSDAAFTLTQIRDLHFAPIWHPEDHPPLPDIVARGGTKDVLACGSCHRADGSGGPENAKLAGLPAAYIAQHALVSGDVDPADAATAVRALTLGLNIQSRFDGDVIPLQQAFEALQAVRTASRR